MQAAVLANNVGARAEHEVKGITKENLGATLCDLLRSHTFDSAISTNRHKGRSLHFASRKLQCPSSCESISGFQFKLHVDLSV